MRITVPATVQRYGPAYGPAYGFSGLGDCCVTTYDDTGAITNLDCSACSAPATGGAIPDTFGGTGPGSGGMNIPSSGAGGLTAAQIAQMFAQGGAAAAQAIAAVNAPPGYVYNPAAGRYMPGTTLTASMGGGMASASLTGSMLPLMLGFGALVLLVMVLKK